MTEPVNKEWFAFADETEAVGVIQQVFPAGIITDENGNYVNVRRAGVTWAINPRGPLPEIPQLDEEGNVIGVLHASDSRYIVQVRAMTPEAKAAADAAWETYGIDEPTHPGRASL